MKRPPRNLSHPDYDGHTEFARMTTEQRLMWLSQAAQFVFAARQTRLPSRLKVDGNRVAETPAQYLAKRRRAREG